MRINWFEVGEFTKLWLAVLLVGCIIGVGIGVFGGLLLLAAGTAGLTLQILGGIGLAVMLITLVASCIYYDGDY